MPTYATISHVFDFNFNPPRSKTVECPMDFDCSALEAARGFNFIQLEKEMWNLNRFKLQMYAILSTDPNNDEDSVTVCRDNPHSKLQRFKIHPTLASVARRYFDAYIPEQSAEHQSIKLGPDDDEETERRNSELLGL